MDIDPETSKDEREAEARVRTRTRPAEVTDETQHVEDDEGFLFVSRTAYGKTEEAQDKIRVDDLVGRLNGMQPARVRLGGGVTRNLGDYNSARVDVMIELPCLPEMSEVSRVVDLLSGELDRIIPDELEKAVGKDN